MKEKLLYEEKERAAIEAQRQKLLDIYLRSKHSGNVALINQAFDFALKAHAGQRRKSGEAYIFHPISVALIVAEEIGMGSTSIAAALLHDTVEDCDVSVEDIERYFSPAVARIVDGVTKISGGVFQQQAENFRKILIMMSADIRVLLIKLADRLHNMRTLDSMLQAKKNKIVGETNFIYIPLATRLGLFNIKNQLEDLCLKYDHPSTYQEINEKLDAVRKKIDVDYENFIMPIENQLKEDGFKFTVQKRIKSPFSIWNKMVRKGLSFEDIYDVLAVRIIFEPKEHLDEITQCWQIYTHLTKIYRPNPRRIRNWLNTPKENGYQALHITLISDLGEAIEVQIRSQRMHQIAERGVAAHWKYKEDGHTPNSSVDMEEGLDRWLVEAKKLLEDPDTDTSSAIQIIIDSIHLESITVSTPKGELLVLKKGSTVLDFAFRLHTELGYSAIAGKVNRQTVELNHVLQNGDRVEVLTSKHAVPKQEWESILVTESAKSKLKKYFREKEADCIKQGEEMLAKSLDELGYTADVINRLLNDFGLSMRKELYLLIGKGDIGTDDIASTLQNDANSTVNFKKTYKLNELKLGETFLRATCCQPIPGDDMFGYMDRADIINVHRQDCAKGLSLKSLSGNRIVDVDWIGQTNNTYEKKIEVKGVDVKGVINSVLNVISKEYEVNMSRMLVEIQGELFVGQFSVFIHTKQELDRLMDKIRQIKDVDTVKIVTEEE